MILPCGQAQEERRLRRVRLSFFTVKGCMIVIPAVRWFLLFILAGKRMKSIEAIIFCVALRRVGLCSVLRRNFDTIIQYPTVVVSNE